MNRQRRVTTVAAMLPLTLRFFIALIACAINERQQKALEFKTEEVLVLRDVLKAVTE